MLKRVISLVTLIAFVIFTLSCGTTHLSLKETTRWEGKELDIKRAELKSGDIIEFKIPSAIRENMIVLKYEAKKMEFFPSDSIAANSGWNKEGKYVIIKQKGDTLNNPILIGNKIYTTYIIEKGTTIPLSDVKVMESSGGKIKIGSIILCVLIGGVLGTIIGRGTAVESPHSDSPGLTTGLRGIAGFFLGSLLGLAVGLTYSYILPNTYIINNTD
jgi:hypothetical protein